MKPDEEVRTLTDRVKDIGELLRFITPLMLTIILFLLGQIFSQIQTLRNEIAESRKFSTEYTNKMVELILKMDDRKK